MNNEVCNICGEVHEGTACRTTDSGARCAGATGSSRVCENCNNAPATHSAHYIESPVQGYFCEKCVTVVGRDRLLLGQARPLRSPNNSDQTAGDKNDEHK